MQQTNVMKDIKVTKITLNIGAGKEQSVLDRGQILLKQITGIDSIKTVTQKRIPGWGLRPGLPIGAKITLRKADAVKLAKRLLTAKNNLLTKSNFDNEGNVSFGIKEYIDIPDTKYDPKIGIMGLQASITLERPGFRVKKRKIMKRSLPKTHRILQNESIEFMKHNFGIQIKEEQ